MASMFSKEGSPLVAGETHTVVGHTVKVEGTFTSDENILIEGEVKGTVVTTKDLTVGKDARIEADVQAANMHIAGEVSGNLQAGGKIEITSSSRIYGDITTDIISIETGAVIQGRCVTGKKTDEPVKEESGAMKVKKVPVEA